jgi:polysaccharide deacetylase family protein (PEP-CTERM system associated)
VTLAADRPPPFLFSVDVEDIPVLVNGRPALAGRVPELTGQYLRFLRAHDMRATFFVLGELAEKLPDLIRRIVDEGHEIGCHGYAHVTLDRQTSEGLQTDLEHALEVLHAAGATRVQGYRAPVLSLVSGTAWAYDVLRRVGFTFSSSVLPGYNPAFGWRHFGSEPRLRDGIWEVPVSLARALPIGLPLIGGVYFRMLPFWFIARGVRRLGRRGRPLVGYLHPYDLDAESESRICVQHARNPLFNYYMFYNRQAVLERLERLMAGGWRIIPYRDYVAEHLVGG